MPNKAIFLDRDGVINIDKGYVYRYDDFEYILGSLDGLRMLYDSGYLLIVVTNQSGIGRGYFDEEEYLLLESRMRKDLIENGSPLTDVYYCPHIKGAAIRRYDLDCDCRKPRLGMFYRAMRDHDIDMRYSYAIGDNYRDLMICQFTACRGFLVGKEGESLKLKDQLVVRIKEAANLLEASREIVSCKGADDNTGRLDG